MKWFYITIAMLAFLIVGKWINENMHTGTGKVEIIHSGVQP